jgi:hypothetical protein
MLAKGADENNRYVGFTGKCATGRRRQSDWFAGKLLKLFVLDCAKPDKGLYLRQKMEGNMLKFALTLGLAMTPLSGLIAQDAPAPPPPMPMPEASPISPHEMGTLYDRLNRDVSGRRAGLPRSATPVPVHPDDVVAGVDVRDSRGKILGRIEKVAPGVATIASDNGRIEIEFASLAKNNKGLLINMTKAKFDAILAGPAKPAN